VQFVDTEFSLADDDSIVSLRADLAGELEAVCAESRHSQRYPEFLRRRNAAFAFMVSLLGPPLDLSRRLRRSDVIESPDGVVLGVRRGEVVVRNTRGGSKREAVLVRLPKGGSKLFRRFLRLNVCVEANSLLFPTKPAARIPMGRRVCWQVLGSVGARLGIKVDPAIWDPPRPRHLRGTRCAGLECPGGNEEAWADLRSIPLISRREYRQHRAGDIMLSGAAPKDFLIFAGPTESPDLAYVAKGPRTGPRECITEHMIAEIGGMLPLRVASSRLARLSNDEHPLRFLSRFFVRPGEELVHGVELVAEWLEVDEREMHDAFFPQKGDEPDFYTVDLILDVLKDTAVSTEYPSLAAAFGRMLAFDALIGTNDRHAMNWGVVRKHQQRSELRFAPVFDTARGLFWHHFDTWMCQKDAAGKRHEEIRQYANQSMPLIGCGSLPRGGRHNHFAVIEHALREYPEVLGRPVRQVVRAFSPTKTRQVLYRKFGRLFSGRRLDWIDHLLRYRHRRLLSIVD
jgi:hypothetical protein